MQSGTFVSSPIERIIYGKPAAAALSAEVERLGVRRVFLIVSGTMNRTTDEVAKIRNVLGERYAGLYDQVPPHTLRSSVLDVARRAHQVDTDLIVTFGGGSVTDAGKMVQLCLKHNIIDLEGFEPFRASVKSDGSSVFPDFDGPTVRQITIPTTLSGGEFSEQAGCTDDTTTLKQTFRHALFAPQVVILDPAPTVHAPLWVWLSTGVRSVDHATEGICSQFSNPISDASFLHALRLLSQALPRVKRHPDDLVARLDCQLAAWLSKIGRQGGVQMGASHAIGHVLGGTCNVPHGYTSCVMLPYVLQYNRTANIDRQRLVAEAMGHPGDDAGEVIKAFVAGLGLPGRLSEVGVGRDQFATISTNAMHSYVLHNNPRKITSSEQVLEILEMAA